MNQPAVPRILVFDSGVGGLSVTARVHEAMPYASIVYLADNAAFPYGDQPDAVVIERCCTLIAGALEQYPCDAVVIACNTASTIALPHLRRVMDVPVVGVVPALKPAAAKTRNHRIGLLATPATVRRTYIDQLIEEFAVGCQVERVGHPGLVQWAEGLVRGVAVPQAELDQAVEGLRGAAVDTVVLGCTHYPLLLDSLKRSLPGVRFWVDSGEAIARRVEWLLAQAGKSASPDEQGGEPRVPVVDALFSGPAPKGVTGFMAAQGLQPRVVTENWPGTS
ncbi:MAG: glutamate racemase [Marinobacter sp.]|uniref:glutamate racemase n=1 Tax=Marinobacter sp. TaxID=50741 RepID=UPI003F99E192